MRTIFILAFLTPQGSHQFEYEAEAILALAQAQATIASPKQAAPCQFCGTSCTCQNCGCDAYHKAAASAVAAPTFQVTQKQHAGHNCPSCGFSSRDTHVIRGFNRDGSHNHSCPKCGTTWNH